MDIEKFKDLSVTSMDDDQKPQKCIETQTLVSINPKIVLDWGILFQSGSYLSASNEGERQPILNSSTFRKVTPKKSYCDIDKHCKHEESDADEIREPIEDLSGLTTPPNCVEESVAKMQEAMKAPKKTSRRPIVLTGELKDQLKSRNARDGFKPISRKCLFGPVNHEELDEFLDSHISQISESKKKRWNFDFAAEEPADHSEPRYSWSNHRSTPFPTGRNPVYYSKTPEPSGLSDEEHRDECSSSQDSPKSKNNTSDQQLELSVISISSVDVEVIDIGESEVDSKNSSCFITNVVETNTLPEQSEPPQQSTPIQQSTPVSVFGSTATTPAGGLSSISRKRRYVSKESLEGESSNSENIRGRSYKKQKCIQKTVKDFFPTTKGGKTLVRHSKPAPQSRSDRLTDLRKI
eukprot:Nk52_evm20s284 gene=Nk52_evmTU20s284